MQKPHFSMRKHAFAAKMVNEKNAYPSPFCQGKSRKFTLYSWNHEMTRVISWLELNRWNHSSEDFGGIMNTLNIKYETLNYDLIFFFGGGIRRNVVSRWATRRFSCRDTTKWIAVTDIDFQTLIIHEQYIYNVVFPFCLRRYINDRALGFAAWLVQELVRLPEQERDARMTINVS